jgi:hypothetical protein
MSQGCVEKILEWRGGDRPRERYQDGIQDDLSDYGQSIRHARAEESA